MTTKRIHESATISVDAATKALRVCLISEGEGSSAIFPRSFFVAENAQALAGSLSYPAHPVDITKPHLRDPLSAIGSIGETVTIEEHEGKMSFWGEYIPAKSKPQVAEYLQEFGHRLGLSIYGDTDGHNENGKWVAESLDANDPYRSVDLVIAAGRGGKFEKVAESLGLLPKASATAGEEEVTSMKTIDDVSAEIGVLSKAVEALVSTLEGKAKATLQVEADTAAVEKLAEARLADYDKAVGIISEAKLTESQAAEARGLALKGQDIAPFIDNAKKVLAEALVLAGAKPGEKVAEHLGGGESNTDDWNPSIAGFGQGRVS